MGVVVGLGVGIGLLLIWSAFTMPRTVAPGGPSSLRRDLDRAGLLGVQASTVVALSVSLFVVVTLAILLLSSTWPVALAFGVVVFVIGYAWLARQAWRGRARVGLAAGLLLLCSPYVTPWYLAWVVPLAAVDEDRLARGVALLLTAYLLPQTIPI